MEIEKTQYITKYYKYLKKTNISKQVKSVVYITNPRSKQ